MIRSVRRLWPALVLIVLLLGALWAVPAIREAGAERQRQAAEAERQAQAGHMGLLGLRERVSLSGGELSVESSPGQGTQVRFVLPG